MKSIVRCRSSSFIMLTPVVNSAPALKLGGAFSAFEFQTYVDEVVGRPRARVLEGELALVARGYLFNFGVELLLAVALDEEGGVHNHLVADGLVRARGDGRVAQARVDFADVGVGALGQRRLD